MFGLPGEAVANFLYTNATPFPKMVVMADDLQQKGIRTLADLVPRRLFIVTGLSVSWTPPHPGGALSIHGSWGGSGVAPAHSFSSLMLAFNNRTKIEMQHQVLDSFITGEFVIDEISQSSMWQDREADVQFEFTGVGPLHVISTKPK